MEQRQEEGEGAANVCDDAVAVGGDRDHAVNRRTEPQVIAGGAEAMVTGAGVLQDENRRC